jgi:serine/threonine-protein kinase
LQRLGAYEIVATIARGGMATVYLGRAPDGSAAALKVIKPELEAQDDFVQMFMDEAQILSQLYHPNLTVCLEHGVSEDRRFIAMELLLGRTVLDAWQASTERGSRFGFDLTAYIGARVAHGLHHAHELHDAGGQPMNLIHRDVTPSNIFLTYDGGVKLFDFGLAKARGKRHATKAGIVKGKVAYFAPEQIELLPLDRRSDVYTLGVTLWELSTMRRLFLRDTDMDTLLAIRAGMIPDPRDVVPGYPDALWTILQRALHHDRANRYATAEELARDLERFLAPRVSVPMPDQIGALLDDLFPGERARQEGWRRQTSSLRESDPPVTMPPPSMLPMALGGPESRR